MASFAKRWARAAALWAVAMVLPSGEPQAAPITFEYSGIVTSVAALDPDNPFPVEPTFGTPFSGTFTFDSAAPDGVPLDATTGVYSSSGAAFGLTLELGGRSFSYGGLTVSVTDGYNSFGFGGDEYLFGIAGGPSAPIVSGRVTDFTGGMLANDALPLSPPSLTGRFATFFFSDIVDGNQVELSGSLNSLAAVSVPEPGTCLLFMAGLAGLATLRRRRQTPGR